MDSTHCREELEELLTRASRPGRPEDDEYKRTAVVLLIFEKNGAPHLLTIIKSDNEGYPWRNQVALPGGHVDKSDGDALAAAYRELEEELGITHGHIAMVGSMGHFQTILKTDIEVFIALWDGLDKQVRVAAEEISAILEIPIKDLVSLHTARHFSGRSPGIDELIYPYEDVEIWGVTARILHFFLEMILPYFIETDA